MFLLTFFFLWQQELLEQSVLSILISSGEAEVETWMYTKVKSLHLVESEPVCGFLQILLCSLILESTVYCYSFLNSLHPLWGNKEKCIFILLADLWQDMLLRVHPVWACKAVGKVFCPYIQPITECSSISWLLSLGACFLRMKLKCTLTSAAETQAQWEWCAAWSPGSPRRCNTYFSR